MMARLARFERATYGLEVRCSIQLSYRRINRMRYLADIRRFVHKKAAKKRVQAADFCQTTRPK